LENDRLRQGIIPDIIIMANPRTPGTDPVNTIFDGKMTLCDIKTLGPGKIYKEKWRKTPSPVNHRQDQVNQQYHRAAKTLDRKFNGATNASQHGPIEEELYRYGHNGKVAGMVVGNYGECSDNIHQLVRFISKHEALKQFYYDDPTVTDRNQVRGLCEKKLVNLWGLTFHRGWARLLIDRSALLLRGGFSDQQGEDDDEMEAWIQEGGTQESHEEV
jgi:hypothetical protein